MALASKTFRMKTYNSLYPKIYSMKNLILAWKETRKRKIKKDYVIEFEKNLLGNLLDLHCELKFQYYKPKPLRTFILRDPKTRKISKSDFRDRIVHHALIRIIEPIFDRTFICDSCANRKGKGSSYALERFEKFRRKITKNYTSHGYCLKADIKHYFQEINNEILLEIIIRKITDEKVIRLIKIIMRERDASDVQKCPKGMPLGNLTSQFFANVYLNELDYFIKHTLKVRYYIRYVDDFVILHNSRAQLEEWKEQIDKFLKKKLELILHKDKSKVISLSNGIDFVGFRNFYYFKLLRKRNIKNMFSKIKKYKNKEISEEKILESFQGWNAYAKWANSYGLRKNAVKEIYKRD